MNGPHLSDFIIRMETRPLRLCVLTGEKLAFRTFAVRKPCVNSWQNSNAQVQLPKIRSQNADGESSTSAISNVTGVSKSTVAKSLKKKLDLFPYRIQLLHKLENGDPQRRFEFAHQFLTNAEFDPQWLP